MNSQASQGSPSSSGADDEQVPEQVPVHTFGEQVLADLNSLCMDEHLSDVSFLVEDQRLPAHRMILAKRSNYFRALLYGGMSESMEGQIRLEVPLEAFKVILGYLYSGTLPISTLDVDAIIKVLGLANLYGFLEVESEIAKHLQGNLAVSNVFTILEKARLFNLADLSMKCLTYMDKHMLQLLKHDSFQMLSKELLEEVLRRDTLCAFELDIFEAVCNWSRNKPRAVFKSVVSLVRLSLMTVDDLVFTVRPTGIVTPVKTLDAIEKALLPSNLPYRAAVFPGVDVAKHWGRLLVNEKDGVMELQFWCLINNISVKGIQSKLSINCTVEISCDSKDWVDVGNVTVTYATPEKEVRFSRRPVRFIRVVQPLTGRVNILNDMTLKAILNTNMKI